MSLKLCTSLPSTARMRSPGASFPSAGLPGSTTPTVGGESSRSPKKTEEYSAMGKTTFIAGPASTIATRFHSCLLYTSDAADERSSVDLGGRRIIKKKKKIYI